MTADTIQLELNRVFAMDAAWSEAAEALRRLDTQGFDRAMSRFNRIKGDCAARTVAGVPSGLSPCGSQAKPLIDYRKENKRG